MEVLQPGDRVRYVGKGGSVDSVLLVWGMIGHIIHGPEVRKVPLDGQEHACYRVMFGAHPAWVRADRLERE